MIPMEFTKRYYGISEAASMFGLKTSTLRFWEKEFLELQPKKQSPVPASTASKTWKNSAKSII